MRKKRRNFKRPVLGDVVEIRVKGGFGYAQYINRHTDFPVYGPLIRVFEGVFDARRGDFSGLVKQKEQFQTFYPLGTAVSQGLVTIVAHEEIPDRCREFPVFKAWNENFRTGKRTWFLWDGGEDRKVGQLTRQQRSYPIAEVITHPVLVERIEQGWRPEDEPE
jgi:hypothetical protein